MDVVLKKIMDHITSCDFSKIDIKIFNFTKDLLIRTLNSLDKQQSSEIAKLYLDTILVTNKIQLDDIRKFLTCKSENIVNCLIVYSLMHFSICILAVTAGKVTEVWKKLFSQVKLTWFFYGNLQPEEILSIALNFELILKRIFGTKPVSSSQTELTGVVMIAEGKDNDMIHKLTSVKHIPNTFR